MYLSQFDCPRILVNVLVDGARSERRKLTDFVAEQVETIEYFPRGSDLSRNLFARGCAGEVYVIWLRHGR